MAYISTLTHLQADLFGIPRQTADTHKRFLLEAGLLSQGARGRNAPHATARDAATLFISLVAANRPSQAVEIVEDFGALVAKEGAKARGGIWEVLALAEHRNFMDALSQLFTTLGDSEVASKVARKLVSGKIFPEVEVSIFDTALSAAIVVERNRAHYQHASLPNPPPIFIDERAEGYSEFLAAKAKYFSGIRSQRSVDAEALFAIASCVSGLPPFPVLIAQARGHGVQADEASAPLSSETID